MGNRVRQITKFLSADPLLNRVQEHLLSQLNPFMKEVDALITVRDLGVANVRDYGAQGDGATDDTSAFTAAIAAINSRGADVGVLYVPESNSPYLVNPITLGDLDKEVLFLGDSVRGSRIKIRSAGTYGIAFNRTAGNSWGGFRNIRVEAGAALTALVYVNSPDNGFFLDHLFLHGNSLVQHGIYANAGSALVSDWLYTTGLTGYNYYLNGQTDAASFTIQSGNHDIGALGFMYVTSTNAGPNINIHGGRIESASGGLDLFQFSTTNKGYLSVHGLSVQAPAPTSIIRKLSGSSPRYLLDIRFQNGVAPTNVFVDDVTPALTIPATTQDVSGLILSRSPSWLLLGTMRLWGDSNGRMRVRSSAPISAADGWQLGAVGWRVNVTYSASMAIDMTDGDWHLITATDGSAFSIGDPAHEGTGLFLTITIRNSSGGALGVATWHANYKMAAWTQPADGYSRSISFRYDGSTDTWIEVSRTSIDVPN